jgi:putative MFS transporter
MHEQHDKREHRCETDVNTGARLDRLPLSAFHHRVLRLVGLGMFFDGFDIYLDASVLGATLRSEFSTLGENAAFVSATFLGMMLGSAPTGFLGDRFGRRFTYRAKLAVFGVAALPATSRSEKGLIRPHLEADGCTPFTAQRMSNA